MSGGYFQRLRAAARARDSLLCIGLDPDPEQIGGGAAGAARFCTAVVRVTTDKACCYKPNAAFWEQYGPEGLEALSEVREAVPSDVPVLFDAKRADVGSTMRAYARAIFEQLQMDAATVHAYHGADSLAEFTAYADRGVYVVARTSNPGAGDLQHLEVGEERMYMRVARLAQRMNGAGNVGLVVGATAPEQVAEVRAALPDMPFLLPGVGAQGGDLGATVRAAWNGDPASCLVTVSRGILYASDPAAAAEGYAEAIRREVAALTA